MAATPPTTGPRALVVGAGIAGLAAASSLHRAGWRVTVCERADARRTGGYFVRLAPQGVAAAVRLGVDESLRSRLPADGLITGVDGRGRTTSRVEAGLVDDGEGLALVRGDLEAALWDGLPAEVDVRFATEPRVVSPAHGTVTLVHDGVERTDRFDLVVGADGVHSGVRALAFGPEREFVRYLGGYSAYFTVPDPGDTDHLFRMYNAPGGLVAGLRPERGGTAKASLSFSSAQPAYERISRADAERVLTERMTGAGWRIDEFLAAMPAADDFYFDSINQVRVETWHRGRIVLLGDAAACGSPLAGLGTSVALVGAYVLAGELAAAGGDHERGFPAFQEVLDAYAKAAMELPPGGFRSFAPHSRLMIWLRAKSWTMMSVWPMSAVMRKMMNRADAIPLPDYSRLSMPVRG